MMSSQQEGKFILAIIFNSRSLDAFFNRPCSASSESDHTQLKLEKASLRHHVNQLLYSTDHNKLGFCLSHMKKKILITKGDVFVTFHNKTTHHKSQCFRITSPSKRMAEIRIFWSHCYSPLIPWWKRLLIYLAKCKTVT